MFIHRFAELGIEDVGLVGGKNASLGEMYRELTPRGVSIPNGFAVSAFAYHYFLREAGITDEVRRILTGLDVSDLEDLGRRGSDVRGTILHESVRRPDPGL
jgi:pyruvate,water dikinase